MSTPDIIEFAKKCAHGSTVKVRQVELAQALLEADRALHHLENGWHGAVNSDEVRLFCKKARARIRSLSKP